ncbi:phage DNA ejection protein [Escherichia coli]|uniref:phage DNA ejection protein n=1 Tax=Escherichia coli TaxID=562 RepID=UPI000BEAD367|nr:phage DNA ejection protein [Escherichia coli]EJM2246161.1 phage DNA ejection protein [Escherichia coli]HAZ3761470.1 DNA transfer protein [Escherichia coli]HAZ3910521.1 DNA transfer protein [Escherichia coli]HAZ4236365.1 DNA transfer protein [Escherichia coli]HAZ4241780.1 DNA transfer protein [Escherichia coli]
MAYSIGSPLNLMSLVPDFRLEGLKEAQTFATTQQGIAQGIDNQRAIRQDARQQEFYKAMNETPPEQIASLRRKFPEFTQAIQQELGIQSAEHSAFVNSALNKISIAASTGNPNEIANALNSNSAALLSLGVSKDDAWQLYQQDPGRFNSLLNASRLATLPMDKQFDVQHKRDQLNEQIRSNQAGEALTARGQNITMRGQDLAMQRASMKGGVGNNERTVQLADGRTVTVGGKLHGAGANAFYEGIDNEGNMVRVPAGSIAAPATSAASAQNYAMKKDLDAISGASIDDLGFMTGITGSSGSPALGADIRSRASGGDQRKLYNAAQRIQGKMQNQGIAAARDMGASGINTVAEAKMYFQGMPQVDFSSPEALQQSMRDIQQYTDNYNQQYNVNVGNGGKKSSMQQPPTQQSAGGSYTSKSGIQFTVE